MATEVQVSGREATPSAAGRFGTFAGVFTPNILTILGIILFLRIGWVVGHAGLWSTLIIIALSNMISLLTGLSLSAIATNMKIKAGGNYYLISRSLGLEIGGAVGIPLYLSQAISVAFYVIGFTEALLQVDMFEAYDARLIATVVTLGFIIIAYIGADIALKIQFGILAVLAVSLISFFIGGLTSPLTTDPPLTSNYAEGMNFWVVFAVFFPAVTGIEVGTSLSGDLKDPGKSIPLGTIASIVVTAIIYVAVALLLALKSDPAQLIGDSLAMQSLAQWPMLIMLGVWASTLSSALGSVLAAPRTLQAISRDSILPASMASRLGSRTEPRAAVLITGAVAFGVIWLGSLNAVAPIITMFFLNTYGMVNLVAGIEKFIGNPSFRPRLRIPSWVSLLGALGCYGAMFLINPVATLFAIAVTYGVYFILKRRNLKHAWGDVRSGIWFALSRYTLLNLEAQDWHVRNWRPSIMVFTGQPYNRQQLVEVADWLSRGQGLVTFFQLIAGDVHDPGVRGLRDTALKHIRRFIEDHGMNAFSEVEIVSDFNQGALMVVQAHGIGGLRSNVALLGWSRSPEGRVKQVELLRGLCAHRKSVLFLNYNPQRGYGKRKTINIWWQGRGGNADLMLLLAHLIQQHHTWQGSRIRLLRIVNNEQAVEDTRTHMEDLSKSVRVPVEPIVIVRANAEQSVAEIISQSSADADFTLLGMHLPVANEVQPYCDRLNDLVQAVGSVLLVRNAELDEDLLAATEE